LIVSASSLMSVCLYFLSIFSSAVVPLSPVSFPAENSLVSISVLYTVIPSLSETLIYYTFYLLTFSRHVFALRPAFLAYISAILAFSHHFLYSLYLFQLSFSATSSARSYASYPSSHFGPLSYS
jgi:hypothetical protein